MTRVLTAVAWLAGAAAWIALWLPAGAAWLPFGVALAVSMVAYIARECIRECAVQNAVLAEYTCLRDVYDQDPTLFDRMDTQLRHNDRRPE